LEAIMARMRKARSVKKRPGGKLASGARKPGAMSSYQKKRSETAEAEGRQCCAPGVELVVL
jgi:hypothetical protein